MPIEKLEEFARDGQKNTDELVLTDGFPRPKFPARQWFNYLFNMLSLKINELIELDPISKTEIVDNLTTNDANKVASARTVKELNDSKLSKLDFDDAYKYMPIPYPKLIPPAGFLVMMGQDIVESIHPKLFALYGPKLPDMRAYSIRGLDNGRGVDTDRIILSEQEDAIRNITGTIARIGYDQQKQTTGVFAATTVASNVLNAQATGSITSYVNSFDASRVVPVASENRIKNIAFLYIVKAG
ncbi:hypothetical protein SKM54_04415 [Acinetobacter faecalis]|uniref:hypothetical protein n=1 Tax=Acinetobacter faecalis TaxID=2665161 RepID=UPI002A90D2AC|nr:hypothetical protein [Acinetobacter faecalis]MDY6481693.1 hypothetical protein [Acinetobacter faecalis]